jgi:aspartate/methionine/tyrosine aminotransferase
MLKLAEAVQRLSVENAFTVLGRAGELEAQGRSVVNLGIGQPDFQSPPHVVEAAVKALRDGHHGYTPAAGIAPLREAVAADIARRLAVEVDPGQVMVVPGGKVTIAFAVMMFGAPGVEILYPDPGFPPYRSLIDYSGARAVAIPHREENGFAFSADEVLSRITPATRLIILNSPSNPTGGVTPRLEVTRLVEGLLEHPHVAVLSDEIYGQMLYDEQAHVSLLQYPELRDRLILLDGWSKTYAMTGWRLGYGIWPPALIGAAETLAINIHSCVNASAQYAGIAALTGPQDAVGEMVSAFDARRRVVVEALNQLPGVTCTLPGGAFYAFPNVTGSGWEDKALATALLEEAGVALLAGSGFGRYGEGFLRISYANSTENILEAVSRMADFLARNPAIDT